MVREEYDATDLSENLIWGVHLVFNGVGEERREVHTV